MEKLIPMFNLAVKNIRGKDEYEMYKNYIKELPNGRIASCLRTFFDEGSLKTKDDFKATQVRKQGNVAYKCKEWKESLRVYTKSLRYATYGGEEYAMALANRSAVNFVISEFKSCIEDINLCLQANYPHHLQPKVYIRKARCFQDLGDSVEMRKALMDALNITDGISAEFSTDIENYKKDIRDLIITRAYEKPNSEESFDVLPVLETNPDFLNASASIMLKYNKKKGCHVVATKEIAVGDVLFVEKAYAFAPARIFKNINADQHCQYCLLKLTSSVPCKTCVKHLYCNESCRDSAWNEFHQWECVAVQAGFETCCGDLSFRIILKAAHTGFPVHTIHFKDGMIKFGDKDNNYSFVHNLPANIHKITKGQLASYVAAAALLVNYLKLKTSFFKKLKQLPDYVEKSDEELMNKIGGLIIRHCGQIHCHSVPVWDFDYATIPNELTVTNTICPSMTMMRHSCAPNTAHYFIGDTVVVKAVKNIKIDKEIYYSYSGVPFSALDRIERQNVLRDNFFLKCNCEICIDPKMDAHNSYLCIKCQGPAMPVDGTTYFGARKCVCLDCNYEYALPMNVVVKEKLAFKFLNRFTEFHNIEDADRSIAMFKTVFRPYHSIFETLYTMRQHYFRTRGNAKGFLENGKLLLNCLKKKRNGPAVKVGRDSFAYCEIAMYLLAAHQVDPTQFGDVLKMLTDLMEEAKFEFNLHHPPFIARLQIIAHGISESQKIYNERTKNEES